MCNVSSLMTDEKYNNIRSWILNARQVNKTWDFIEFGGKKDEAGLQTFLDIMADTSFWSITCEEWHVLVKKMKEVEEMTKGGFLGEPKKPLMGIPTSPGSCWVNYKKRLQSKNFTFASINGIEKSAQKIISQLNPITEQTDPVTGMVVGNVQSGKTANMAGVIAMAADYGYNFFIVLTGTIDNLRIQTRDRLIGDLDNTNNSLVFFLLDQLSSKTVNPNRLQDLKLDPTSNRRYITVCLKNSTRLKNLLNWINKDPYAKSQLKILLIDDEADQAGVNTKDISKDEQTAISRLIKNIVFGKDANDKVSGNYASMNYIGYTATPYANFLNESGPGTLYPKNFISLLSPANEYFGPQQIFGVNGVNTGLDIINEISEDDIADLDNNADVLTGILPDSLKDSLTWFIITVAIFRYWNLKRNASMLIHTSQRTDKHGFMAQAIEGFFKNNTFEDLLPRILKVYEEQCNKLTLYNFCDEMATYNNLENIKNYPNIEDLLPYIEKLLNIGLTHIEMDDTKTLSYNEGLHLCVDNCTKNPFDNSYHLRLVYPDKNDKIMEKSPAFIVIGGSTLSRGLTIDGLTTSYFLRTTNQADTLMQMGRWFGYRPNYELLPRLWLSNQTRSRFNRLTQLDYDLRDELYNMEIKGLSPKEYGPRLDSFPDYKLLVITAKNKLHMAIEYQCTFYNKTSQTTTFYSDEKIIHDNYELTHKFLDDLGPINKSQMLGLQNKYVTEDSAMWFDVDYNIVLDFLNKLKIPSQIAKIENMDDFKKWYETEFDNDRMKNWTIVASGAKNKIHTTLDDFKHFKINLPTRTKVIWDNRPEDKDIIDLKTITQPEDMLMDIDFSQLTEFEISEVVGKKLRFKDKRIKFAHNDKPLLVIYIIDKDSGYDMTKPSKSNKYTRHPLNLKDHLVGYYLYIPYGTDDSAKNTITIKLNYSEEKESEVDDSEE